MMNEQQINATVTRLIGEPAQENISQIFTNIFQNTKDAFVGLTDYQEVAEELYKEIKSKFSGLKVNIVTNRYFRSLRIQISKHSLPRIDSDDVLLSGDRSGNWSLGNPPARVFYWVADRNKGEAGNIIVRDPRPKEPVFQFETILDIPIKLHRSNFNRAFGLIRRYIVQGKS